MTVPEIVQFLRLNVSIQTKGSGTQDKAFLTMTDEEILLYLNVVLTRDFAYIPSLDVVPAENVYPLILLAKKELYYALATVSAPLFDLGADSNYLKRDQRFKHYMLLIEQADREYEQYKENGGAGGNTLTSFDVLLSNRYGTKRNYEKGAIPVPLLYVDRVFADRVQLHWVHNLLRYAWVNLYVSEAPVLAPYKEGFKIDDVSAQRAHILDARQTTLELVDLKPSTVYYIALAAVEASSLVGYAEVNVTTLTPAVPVRQGGV